MRSAVQIRCPEPIYYPDTDGKPMADSDLQRKPLTYLVEALDLHFQSDPKVYVSGDLLIYYEEGNPKKSVAPDVFVVFGVPKHERDIYQTWGEGKGPDVVIEIASHSTHRVDEKIKPGLYQQLGVQEYFQYDPRGLYLKPALRGRCLNSQGQYEPVRSVLGLDESVILTSPLLGLQLRLEAGQLRLFDPQTGNYLETYAESVMARRFAEAQVQLEQQRTNAERRRAESERQRADAEQQRADKLAAQLRALGLDPDQVA